jgi:hypothetical protein
MATDTAVMGTAALRRLKRKRQKEKEKEKGGLSEKNRDNSGCIENFRSGSIPSKPCIFKNSNFTLHF